MAATAQAGDTMSPSSDQESFHLKQRVDIPVVLYKSLQGKYFVGHAENLEFEGGTGAWASLYNPPHSGVNLFVNVWTVAVDSMDPFDIEIWFNARVFGVAKTSTLITPSNLAIFPAPPSPIKLKYASNVTGAPFDGANAYNRTGEPGPTLVAEEDGKFIFAPGGSFMVFLRNLPGSAAKAVARIAFGWWIEPIQYESSSDR